MIIDGEGTIFILDVELGRLEDKEVFPFVRVHDFGGNGWMLLITFLYFHLLYFILLTNGIFYYQINQGCPIIVICINMLTPNQQQIRNCIQNHSEIKNYISTLIKDLKYTSRHSSQVLEQTTDYLREILLSINEHPTFKLNTNKFIMYLLLMGEPEVYEQFQNKILPIMKGNCQYNKTVSLKTKGEDFFKKSHFYTETKNGTQKSEIKKTGINFIRFCHETVFNIAKWLPYEIQNSRSPTKFSLVYESLKREGVQFPKEQQFVFYKPQIVQQIQMEIKQIQRQLYSSYHSEGQFVSGSLGELKLNSHKGHSNMIKHFEAYKSNEKNDEEKVKWLSHRNQELEQNIQEQKNFFQGELQRQREFHQQNIKKYQKKISYLEEEMQKMKEKIVYLETRTVLQPENNESKKHSFSLNEQKDRVIEDLTKKNKEYSKKIKNLQLQLNDSKHKNQSNFFAEDRVHFQKLKKQNKLLKAKLLTQCEETTQFKSTEKGFNAATKRGQNSLQFIGYEDARSCYEPFYSNSSTENKIRLRKAILREKQLLYKDKSIEIGCISKLQERDTIRMIVVCTNISQKPIFQFLAEFVNREDISTRIISEGRNYLQIGGQTKTELLITIKNIDFKCLLCSLKFRIEEKESKIALILPVSKLKLAKQQVFTPINEKKELSKMEKIVYPDKKIIPTLNKFKQYFKYALLEKDRTGHETYYLKLEFLGCKFYLECDEVGGELRLAVRYEVKYLAEAEKLLDELVFIFSK